MTRPGIESRSPGSLAITLPTRPMGPMVRVFVNNPGDWGSIIGRVIPKIKKIVLDNCEVEKGVAPFQHIGVVAIEKGAFRSPSTAVATLLLLIYIYICIYIYIYIYIYI